MDASILIIDDDTSILEVSRLRFQAAGFDVHTADSGQKGLDILSNHQIHLVILDVKMPGMDGKEVLKEIQSLWPGLPVIMLTAYGAIPDAVEAVRFGAMDYLTKPYDGSDLVEKVRQCLEAGYPKRTSSPEKSLSEHIWGGQSPSMQRLFELIARVAPTNADVLITGESGTGKELVARILHEMSSRSTGPFTIVDCSTTSATLLESELFGHKKGSFTNAYQDRKGLIQEAHQGTLFLDEIGNISLEMQAKLLRFLQERTIRRIGESKEISVDCRVLAATNAELSEMIQDGEFREDLYFRLKGFNLHVPSLTERREDIPILAEKYLAQFSKELSKPNISLSKEAMDRLMGYAWPGNVRELRQVLRTAVILSGNDALKAEDLQLESFGREPTPPSQSALSLEESEKQAIIRALEQSDWVQKEAAKLLGISRRAVNYKIKRYGIQLPRKKGSP